MSNLLRMTVEDYLGGTRPLSAVQEILMPITWGEVSVDSDLRELADESELAIAEFTGGHIGEAVLRTALTNLFRNNSLVISTGDFSSPFVTLSGSQSQTQRLVYA